MSSREALLTLNAQSLLGLERLESATVRQIAAAYEETLQAVTATITARRAQLARAGAEEQAALAEALARDQALFRQIEARLAMLRKAVGEIVGGASDQSRARATDRAGEELEVLRGGLGLGLGFSFEQVDFASIEIGLEEALAALDADQAKLAALLRAELRGGLARGESFEDLVRRLLSRDASWWRNGQVSAERAARRAVIDANNGARDLYYRTWRQRIPGLRKQAVATISDRTTDTCLQVHGQIRDLDEPYQLTGAKAFAPRMMYPAFHWGCRTSSVPYHADFEVGAAVTTAEMQAAARSELERRV